MLIYDKLMIYYLMLMLMLVGINEILIIFILEDILCFESLFGDGYDLGIYIEYVV